MRKKTKQILELIKRLDEVVKRAMYRRLPDHLANCRMDEWKFWLVESIIKEKYIPFSDQEDDEGERLAQNGVYKLLEACEKNEQETA